MLAPHHDRITWDAPIHSVADVLALPFPPRMLNVKPSRFGSAARAARLLRPLRRHASRRSTGAARPSSASAAARSSTSPSLFHPDTPNDVAPAGYNLEPLPAALPGSPLAPAPSPTGFRWGHDRARTGASASLDEVRFADLDVHGPSQQRRVPRLPRVRARRLRAIAGAGAMIPGGAGEFGILDRRGQDHLPLARAASASASTRCCGPRDSAARAFAPSSRCASASACSPTATPCSSSTTARPTLRRRSRTAARAPRPTDARALTLAERRPPDRLSQSSIEIF